MIAVLSPTRPKLIGTLIIVSVASLSDTIAFAFSGVLTIYKHPELMNDAPQQFEKLRPVLEWAMKLSDVTPSFRAVQLLATVFLSYLAACVIVHIATKPRAQDAPLGSNAPSGS